MQEGRISNANPELSKLGLNKNPALPGLKKLPGNNTSQLIHAFHLFIFKR